MFLLPGFLSAQKVNIRTNLLYWATSTPNVGVEWRLSPKYSFSVSGGYNAFDFRNRTDAGGVSVNPKLHHWLVMPELRYWLCRTFERHYLGVHALYGEFNVGGVRFPSFLENGRYEGRCGGGGLDYGYQWAVGRRCGLDLSVGVGYVYLRYDKYDCGACGEKRGRFSRHYFGPTKAAVSFIYYIR